MSDGAVEGKCAQRLALPMAASELLPHGETMLLAGELVRFGEDFVSGRMRIDEDNAFVDAAGRLEAPAMIEAMAQCGGLHICYASKSQGKKIKIGYLAAVQEFSYIEPARLGDTLDIETRSVKFIGPAMVMEFLACRDDTLLARGRITFWTPDELPEVEAPLAGHTQKRDDCVEIDQALRLESRCAMRRANARRLVKFDAWPESMRAEGLFNYPSDFLGFRGHFPEHKVLPAVLMLDAAALVAERIAGRPLEIASVEQAKFTRPVYPDQSLLVSTQLAESANGFSVKATLEKENQKVAKMTFSLRESE